MIAVIVLWIVFALLVGLLANNYGRDGKLYFLIALLLSPLISLIIVLIIGKTEEKKAKEIETQIRMRAEIEEKIRLEKMRAEKIENAVKDRMRINE